MRVSIGGMEGFLGDLAAEWFAVDGVDGGFEGGDADGGDAREVGVVARVVFIVMGWSF